MVRGHVLDRLAAEYSRAVERAAVQEHEREAQIVLDGRDRTTSAAREFRRVGSVAHPLWLARQRIGRQTFRVTMDAFRRNDETRVGHSERPEETLVEKLGERPAGDRFYRETEHVETEAVIPFR